MHGRPPIPLSHLGESTRKRAAWGWACWQVRRQKRFGSAWALWGAGEDDLGAWQTLLHRQGSVVVAVVASSLGHVGECAGRVLHLGIGGLRAPIGHLGQHRRQGSPQGFKAGCTGDTPPLSPAWESRLGSGLHGAGRVGRSGGRNGSGRHGCCGVLRKMTSARGRASSTDEAAWSSPLLPAASDKLVSAPAEFFTSVSVASAPPSATCGSTGGGGRGRAFKEDAREAAHPSLPLGRVD